MRPTIHFAFLLLLLPSCVSEVVDKSQRFASLPFSFGLVLNLYSANTSENGWVQPQVLKQSIARNSPENSDTQNLQAISVAEVFREPAFKRNRASPSVIPLACLSESVLKLDLTEGLLTSSQQLFAFVDVNRQLQFVESRDGYTQSSKAWSVSAKGQLEYGNSTLFYQCHSGDTYKLHDSPVHSWCAPVLLDVVELVACQ